MLTRARERSTTILRLSKARNGIAIKEIYTEVISKRGGLFVYLYVFTGKRSVFSAFIRYA